MEGSVDRDAGASLRDGIKCMEKLGVCPEAVWKSLGRWIAWDGTGGAGCLVTCLLEGIWIDLGLKEVEGGLAVTGLSLQHHVTNPISASLQFCMPEGSRSVCDPRSDKPMVPEAT